MPRSVLWLVMAAFTAGYFSHAVVYPIAREVVGSHAAIKNDNLSMKDAVTGKTKFCAMVAHGHWVTWLARNDGLCYLLDAPDKD